MSYFPMFLDLTDKKILIVGGGEVAKRKVNVLLQFTDNITVIAERSNIKSVKTILKCFEKSDLKGYDIIIGATNDNNINAQIYAYCKKENIPVNIVDDKEKSTFIFPAIVKKGDLTVAVSTSGKSPVISQEIRNDIEKNLPENIEITLDEAEKYRQNLIKKNVSYDERKKLMREFYEKNS